MELGLERLPTLARVAIGHSWKSREVERSLAMMRRRLLVVAAGLVVLVLVGGGCGWRGGVEILDGHVYLEGRDVIRFAVNSCERGAAVSHIEETAKEVKIKVTHQVPRFSGVECAEIMTCLLKAPLGSRTLIDLHTGNTIYVQRMDQNPLSPQPQASLSPSYLCETPE